MKKILNNKLGMTLVEVLLAIVIFVLIIWTFAPFIASTFKQIAQAGTMHVELAKDVSTIDGWIADEFYGAPSTFPVKVGTNENIDVNGIHLSSGKLHTFYSNITSYITSDDILYEGYGSDDFYDGYFSIGFLPEVTDKKFFKNLHTYVVELRDSQDILNNNDPPDNTGFIYLVDEDIDVLPPSMEVDPDSIYEYANLFLVASQFPDGVGGNPDKIAYLLLHPDTWGLDNAHSPYSLNIKTKDTGQTFLPEDIVFSVMLPLYQAVGDDGLERIASFYDYWVDKWTHEEPDYGNADPLFTPKGISMERLPIGVDFYDVLWYPIAEVVGVDANGTNIESEGRYYTVGDGGNLWYRRHQLEWTQLEENAPNSDLNRIKRINDLFMVIGSDGAIWTSSEGLESWNNYTVSASGNVTENLTALAYSPTLDLYVVMADNGNVYVSGDFGSSYLQLNSVTAGTSDGGSYEPGEFEITDMVWTGYQFVAVGTNNYIAVSSNGIDWEILDPAVTINAPDGLSDFHCVYIYKSMGFILGESGQIFSFSVVDDISELESDGWSTLRNQSQDTTPKDLYDMTYSRKHFIVVGQNGKVMYSRDGRVWTDCTTMEGFNTALNIYAVSGRE